MKKTITEEELAILKDVSEREFLTLTEEEQKSIKIIVNRIEKEEQEEREKEEVLQKIEKVILENNFPTEVLKDVIYRIQCNDEVDYLKNQLRFLNNWLKNKRS